MVSHRTAMLSALFMNTSGLKALHIIAQGIALRDISRWATGLRGFVGGEMSGGLRVARS